ncbi:hypothetical protein PsYK624_108390 [Phanerochaete sordida]|uniref:DUF6533 domain-containing protein n=1 Tax=Phanerochaete sordida TaxID=48140 RepID=A0A9P3GEN1_9APHY|nr:hypothetical protein PsYK624_108390 [Phanerochaete sordida]
MSTHLQPESAGLAITVRVEDCITCACFALAVYELCITLADDLRIIWRSKRTAASILYAVNRWTLLAYVVDALSSVFNKSPWDSLGILTL